MTVTNSGMVIFLRTINSKVVGILYRDEKGYLCAAGKSFVNLNDLVNTFEEWIEEDPEGYEIFKDKVIAAFDIAGRDLDKEKEALETLKLCYNIQSWDHFKRLTGYKASPVLFLTSLLDKNNKAVERLRAYLESLVKRYEK